VPVSPNLDSDLPALHILFTKLNAVLGWTRSFSLTKRRALTQSASRLDDEENGGQHDDEETMQETIKWAHQVCLSIVANRPLNHWANVLRANVAN
jgi:hypothetical protein